MFVAPGAEPSFGSTPQKAFLMTTQALMTRKGLRAAAA